MSPDQPDPFSCVLTVAELDVLIRLAGGALPDSAGWVELLHDRDQGDREALLTEAGKSLLARGLALVQQAEVEVCAPLLEACQCIVHRDWTLEIMSTTSAGEATFATVFSRGGAGTLIASAEFGNVMLRYQPDALSAVDRVLDAVANASGGATTEVAPGPLPREDLDAMLGMPDLLLTTVRLGDESAARSDCCWITTPGGAVILETDGASTCGTRVTTRGLRNRLADYCSELPRAEGV